MRPLRIAQLVEAGAGHALLALEHGWRCEVSMPVEDVGRVLWHPPGGPREPRTQVPLPAGVRCLAIAASRQARAGQRPRGEGLVPVSSALGIPTRHRSIAYGTNHLDLLGSAIVYDRLSKWLRNGV